MLMHGCVSGGTRRCVGSRPCLGGGTRSHAVKLTSKQWQGPPASFTLQSTKPKTRQFIVEKYPDLVQLVDEGTLVVFQRPDTYVERRTDGYREPEQIFIVGTAHVSDASARNVKLAVEKVKPDAVVVELCKGRSAALYQDQASKEQQQLASQPISMTGHNLVQAFLRSVALGGTTSLVIQLMLSYALKQVLPSDGSIRTGLEFVEARKAAEKEGAQLVLGDRPIEITIDRCWAALTSERRWEVLKMLFKEMDMWKKEPMDAAKFNESIEKLASEDGVEEAMQVVVSQVPELVQPLIHERDLYLAWSMKRSKAVNGASRVVGVVGKGHLKGIMYAMENDPQGMIRFTDLVGGRNTKEYKQKQRRKVVRDLVRDTAIFGALGWLLHSFGLF